MNFRTYGDIQQGAVEQMTALVKHGRVIGAALMADHHLGYSQPIGGVVAYDGQVSVSGVGFDIACGNKAIKTDATYGEIKDRLPQIADTIFANIEFGVGKSNVDVTDHAVFSSSNWDTLEQFAGKTIATNLKDRAYNQLGTVGSGNHYVDIFAESIIDSNGVDIISDDSPVWIGVHFGSRGLGHNIATGFLKIGSGFGWDEKPPKGERYEKEEPTLFEVDSDNGKGYWGLMQLAGEYAYAGRDYVVSKVAKILGVGEVESIHNHHNFAWMEKVNGIDSVVVRKGSTPLWPNQKSFIGGSMCDVSVIVEGIHSDFAEESFFSTVHGAGRVMGRMQAKGKVNRKTGEVKRPGLVTLDMFVSSIKDYGIELRGGGFDESEFVYRKLDGVLEAHKDSTRVLTRLKPVVVCMAGADVYDPWKD